MRPPLLVVVRRKMSAAMTAMAAAPIRAASSRRAPRSKAASKVRTLAPRTPPILFHPRVRALSPLGSRQRTAWRRRLARGASGDVTTARARSDRGDTRGTPVSCSPRRDPSDPSRAAARATARDPTARRSSTVVHPSRARFSAVPARTRTLADLAAPPRTQASKRNIARPAVSEPSMVSVSAPRVPRRPTTRAGSGRIERFPRTPAATRKPRKPGVQGKAARHRLPHLPRPSPTDR